MVGNMLFKLFAPLISGSYGESYISRILNSLPQDKYRVIDNVLMETERGTSQIDHIIVSVYGIFVIETKNYKGIISGTKYGDMWTQNLYGRKYKFYNPSKQNYGHIKTLQAKLNLPENKFISVVVFLRRCTIIGEAVRYAVQTSQLNNFIEIHKEEKFAESDLDYIVDAIHLYSKKGFGAKVKHVIDVKTNVYQKEKKIASGICPRCGGQLVQRKGKYGFFTGCSNYPKCRYTGK